MMKQCATLGSSVRVEDHVSTRIDPTELDSLPTAHYLAPTDSRFATLLPPLLSAALLWLSYFPMNWGWLTWVALAPLLALVRSPVRRRWVYLAAWLGGLAFFVPVLQWLRVADYRMYYTWIALALACSLFFPLGMGLIRLLDRRTRLPLIVSVPVVWTALEFLRAHILTGFPWYFLAHAQHDFLAVIQIADVTGAYGVSFLVAAVNALLFELLATRHWFRRLVALPDSAAVSTRFTLACHTGLVLLALGGTLAYGQWRLRQTDFTPGPRLALIQGNLDQRLRIAAKLGDQAAAVMLRHYQRLSNLAAAQRPLADLIVWPETSFPDEWPMVSPGIPASDIPAEWSRAPRDGQEVAHKIGSLWQTNVLLGLNTRVLEADHHAYRYNSGLLIRWDGQKGTLGERYDKIHRVLFGEYVPLVEWLPWLRAFAPYDFDYSIRAGQNMTRFPLGDVRFGMIICYEDTDPCLARQYVRDDEEPPVDLLINISNDGWFNGTSEHEQHLATCRFRAVESRRPVVRSVNMGISALIDSNGRVLAPRTSTPSATTSNNGDEPIQVWEVTPEHGWHDDLPASRWHEFKKVAGVLTVVPPLDRRGSIYAHWGDWLPELCWFVIGAGLLTALTSRRGSHRNQPRFISG